MVEEMPMIEINDVEPQRYREKNGEERGAPDCFCPDADAGAAMLGGVEVYTIAKEPVVAGLRAKGNDY